VVPERVDALAGAEDCATVLWRARQELSGHRRRVGRERPAATEQA
jgi:hypothetical protein